MTWGVLARHEARQSYRARSIRFLLGIFVFVSVIGGYVYPVFASEPYTTAHFGGYIASWMTLLVPLLGLVIGYNAIVSERTSGALFLSLSLPHSRRDLVLGKYAGRLGLLTLGIVASLFVAGALVVYPFGDLRLLPFLGFVVLTVGLAAVYTGIGIGISMVTRSKQRATVAAFGLYFLLVLIWNELRIALAMGLGGVGLLDGELPGPIEFVFASEPGNVYTRLIIAFIDPSQSLNGSWYLNEWLALALFAIWLVVPLGMAYRWFLEVDL